MRVLSLAQGSDATEFFENVGINPNDFPSWASLELSYDVAKAVRVRVSAFAVARPDRQNAEIDSGAIIGCYDPDSTSTTGLAGVIRKSNARVSTIKSLRSHPLVLADFVPKYGVDQATVTQVGIVSLPFDTAKAPGLLGYSVAIKLPAAETDPSQARTVLVEEQLELELSVPK